MFSKEAFQVSFRIELLSFIDKTHSFFDEKGASIIPLAPILLNRNKVDEERVKEKLRSEIQSQLGIWTFL